MALAHTILLPCIFLYSTLSIVNAATCSSDRDDACIAKQALTQDVLPSDKLGIELLQKSSASTVKPHKTDEDEELTSALKKLEQAHAEAKKVQKSSEDTSALKKVEQAHAEEKKVEKSTEEKKQEKKDDAKESKKADHKMLSTSDESEEAKLQEEGSSSSKSDSKHDQKKHTEQRKKKKSSKKHTVESDYELPSVNYLLLAKNKWCNNEIDAKKIKNGPSGKGYTHDTCEAACSDDVECTAFSFDEQTGWCSAYHKCGTPTKIPNGQVQDSRGWRTYEKVFMPKESDEEDASDSSKKKSKASSGSKKANKEADKAHLQEEDPAKPPLDAWEIVARGKWCNVENGGIIDEKGTDGHLLTSCQAACSKRPSCMAFSYDESSSFCATFKKCGTPTETPPSKKTSQGAHQAISGWVTYERMSEREFEKAAEKAHLREEKKAEKERQRKEFDREVEMDFQVYATGLWCDISSNGTAVKEKHGIASGDYTLEKCKRACARSETCEAFSFDSKVGWCTTFAMCGNVTSTPNGKVQDTSGMVTYVKWQDAPDIARLEGDVPLAWTAKDDDELQTTLPGTGPDNKPVQMKDEQKPMLLEEAQEESDDEADSEE